MKRDDSGRGAYFYGQKPLNLAKYPGRKIKGG